MKKLSSYQASRCENAKGEKCTCRCHGILHGKSHQGLIEKELFEEKELLEKDKKDV